MADALLAIRQAGPHVSIQDRGRPGLARFGIPRSGPMDRIAFALAQAAAAYPGANPDTAAAIEVSLGGLHLEVVEGSLTVAIAGGGFVVELNGTSFGSWNVLTLAPGDRLTIRPGPWGCWCYLAFTGEIEAPTWLGSRATHALSGLGGGRLRAGDRLSIRNATPRPELDGPIPCPVFARPRGRMQLVMGPQDRFFAPEVQEILLTQPFKLTQGYDRMGVRLDGPRLPPENALAIPSEALLRGSIQVSGDGVATVLLADHQTTGGYPRIATLAGPEADRFAQLRPGGFTAFRAIGPEVARQLTRQRASALASVIAGLARRGGRA